MLVFLIQHLNFIVLLSWFAMSLIALLRYFDITFFVKISWRALVVAAIVLNVLFVVIYSCAQYIAWNSSDIGRQFLSLPLPSGTPLPTILEGSREFFNQALGYYSFYIFGRFILPLIILLFVVAFLGAFFNARAWYRPRNFNDGDIYAIIVALLISGWPGVIVLVPLGFTVAVFLSVVVSFFGIKRISLSPAFLLTAPFALIFGTSLLKYFHLYTVLKI